MRTQRKQYPDLYTWSHPLGDHVLAHQDGAVSTCIDWPGMDFEMQPDPGREFFSRKLLSALMTIEAGYCAEFHFWREWDSRLARDYRNRRIKRGGAFAKAIRKAQADHLSDYGMSNQVGVVLTKPPVASFFGGAKTALKRQSRAAKALVEAAGRLASKLPDGRVTPLQEYYNRVRQSYDRARFNKGYLFHHDPRFLLSESIIAEAPSSKVSDHILIGDAHSKVLYLYFYPDAFSGWFMFLSTLNLPLHISFSVKPTDRKAGLKEAEDQSEFAEGTISKRGVEDQTSKLDDLRDFRSYVVRNKLPMFENCFVIHLHGTLEENIAATALISEHIEDEGEGQVRCNDDVQLPFWRTGQPGQGYRNLLWRVDEGLQLANMLPVQVFDSGEKHPESLRLGESGQLIGFSRLTGAIAHSFTVAKTGSGKGQDKVATVAESFPMGMDWCIAEIGSCYKWIVEGFGGSYTRIDPRETVVNPLPGYKLADQDASLPLPPDVIGPTLGALGFLLTDGRTTLTVHEEAAAQTALQLLYARPDQICDAPALPDLHRELEHFNAPIKEQEEAARLMEKNLYSFLSTTEGQVFTQQTNLKLSDHITGVDLIDVEKASPKLLKFYLIFIALQFDHFAFANPAPTTILLDELHKFMRVAPLEIGRLISELARMGRKNAGNIDMVSQGTKEIDAIEKEVLNSMHFASLLYRNAEWAEIAERISMPEVPLKLWREFPDPIDFDWRPSIQSVSKKYYNLHLSFPDLLLDLGTSSPRDLVLKEQVGKRTSDPLERLRLFRQHKKGVLV
ncbi:MAG: hypothetical protein ACE5F7_04985 [Nitrospiria bacterium]